MLSKHSTRPDSPNKAEVVRPLVFERVRHLLGGERLEGEHLGEGHLRWELEVERRLCSVLTAGHRCERA